MSLEYVDYYVDVFSKTNQHAQVLPGLKPPQLIRAILTEFHDELEFLGVDPAAYHLCKGHGVEPLDDQKSLDDQVEEGERLTLVENELSLPPGAHRPSSAIYLREHTTGRAYRLHWHPAVVGCWSEQFPQNELVAVDLSEYPGGVRVSRRHVLISEEDGDYFIRALSSNPVSLIHNNQEIALQDGVEWQHLVSGDVIKLERSDIRLVFIVRRIQQSGGGKA